MKVVFSQEQFLYGISKSPTVGRGFPRLDGVDLMRDLGYMSAGYGLERVLASSITKAPYHLLLDNSNADGLGKSYLWGVADDVIYKVDIETSPETLTMSASTASGFNRGALSYKGYLYVASGDDIGRGLISATNSDAFAWTSSWLTNTIGETTSDSSAPHPMIQMKDNMYRLDGRWIDKYDGTTYTKHALDLETGWVGISPEKWGEFMVIGAVKEPDSYSRYGTLPLLGRKKSRLFFWDTYSESWDKDRSTEIDGRLVWVKNKKGVIYTLVQHKSGVFELGYFDGNTIQSLKKFNFRTWDDCSAIYEPAKDIMSNFIYFAINSATTGFARIMAYGQYDGEMPNTLFNPYYISPAIAKPSSIFSLKWAEGINDAMYMGLYNETAGKTGLYRVQAPWSSTGTPGTYNIETPNISGEGKQMMKSIRINHKPLASGDVLYLYRKIDNANWEGAIWATTSYARHPDSVSFSIDEEFEFRDFQLKLVQPNGANIRIKDIVIESEDIDEL